MPAAQTHQCDTLPWVWKYQSQQLKQSGQAVRPRSTRSLDRHLLPLCLFFSILLILSILFQPPFFNLAVQPLEFNPGSTKVDQQTDFEAGGLEIVDYLGLVYRCSCLTASSSIRT